MTTTDDQWLDLFAIKHLTENLFISKNSIYCPVIRDENIPRTPGGWLSLTLEEWPRQDEDDDEFPDFCSDMLYIMPRETVKRLVDTSVEQTRVLGSLDSVWLTGCSQVKLFTVVHKYIAINIMT